VVGLSLALVGLGCASSRVSDLGAYERVPMNRVVPYPSKQERRHRVDEVVVLDRPSMGSEEDSIEAARAQVRRRLETIAVDAGAVVRFLPTPDEMRVGSDARAEELEAAAAAAQVLEEGVDLALVPHFSVYRALSEWTPPYQFLWQSDEEVAEKPGTCIHTVEIELAVEVVRVGNGGGIERSFVLRHSDERELEELDRSCPIPPAALNVLFENTLSDALGCLDRPLGSLLLPRGHVTGHRWARDVDRHIYRISLGSAQGIEPGETVEVRREQRSLRPDGEETRSERVIATGIVTDLVKSEVAWVGIDPSGTTDEILEGDVVRPVQRQGLLSSLSGPDCGRILEER
jgi:hypothetical protein